MLGNISFLQGSRRFLYAVTPKETSFEKLGDVPDYLNEVSYFNYLSMHAGCVSFMM